MRLYQAPRGFGEPQPGDPSGEGGSPGAAGKIGPPYPGAFVYALMATDGRVLAQSGNLDPAELPDVVTLGKATGSSAVFVDKTATNDVPLRLSLSRVQATNGDPAVVVIGRSTEPEHRVLDQAADPARRRGLASLGLALVGGYFIDGRTLTPIRKAMAAQRTFVADASHEIRMPLSIVQANAEMLQRHANEPVEANIEAVEDVLASSTQLNKIVNQLIALARADAGERSWQAEPIDLTELAAEVVRAMTVLARDQQVRLTSNNDGAVQIDGNRDRLRELLVLLLDNAIKYTPASGEVHLAVEKAGNRAVLRVRNTGSGIPSEALPHIFDRLFRVDKVRSRESGGAGLWLSIARAIVEAHGGSIRAESAARRGHDNDGPSCRHSLRRWASVSPRGAATRLEHS